MTDTQFDQLVKMLDNIRCGIIDVETAIQNTGGTQPTSTNNERVVIRRFDHCQLSRDGGFCNNTFCTTGCSYYRDKLSPVS